MPLYAFVNESGEQVERFYNMEAAPSIGEVVTVEGGVKLTRVPDFHIDSAGIARKVWGYPFVAYSQPRNIPGQKCDEKGRAIISSQRDERNFCAKNDCART